jgi:electron transfer flavoprotein beta subunit
MALKIVVAVKQIRRLQDDFKLRSDGRDVDPTALEYDLNEWDAFSVEEAVRMVEAQNGQGEVVAISVGDERVKESLLRCLAKGATRAIRIWDEAMEGSDPIAVGRVLAAAIKREEPDLVFAGVQSTDAVYSATGVSLAEFLGLPHVAVVKKLEYHQDPTPWAMVLRELEGGLLEEINVQCPAVLTIQTGINEPRYASLRMIKQAEQKPLTVLGLNDLGLDASKVGESGSQARVRRMFLPKSDKRAEPIQGNVVEIAAKIAQIVREKMK